MPNSRPICSCVGIWCVWSLVISLAIALVMTMTSTIARRPRPSAVLTRICVTTASRLCDRKALGLFALLGRQGIDEPVDGLDGAGGVQRSEHQMPGFGRRHRHADGLGVTQLADQDHVRILAHGGAHALGEARDVGAELALNDLAGSCCDGRTRSDPRG